MVRQSLSFLVIFTCVTGCSKQASVKELQQAFEKPKEGGVSAAAVPEVKAAMDRVTTAMQTGDQMTAVANLDELRHRQDLSVDQAVRVQEMMGRVQTQIAERAAAGDPQAKAQLEMIRMGKMRR
jgi:hypothetical protein